MLRAVTAACVLALSAAVLVPGAAEAATKSGYVSKCKKPEKWNAVEGKCVKAEVAKKAPVKKAPAKKA